VNSTKEQIEKTGENSRRGMMALPRPAQSRGGIGFDKGKPEPDGLEIARDNAGYPAL
jgi:hypothetical protein